MPSSGDTRLIARDFETKLQSEYDFQREELDDQEVLAYRLTHRVTRAVEYLHLVTTGDVDQRVTHALRRSELITNEATLRRELKLSDGSM